MLSLPTLEKGPNSFSPQTTSMFPDDNDSDEDEDIFGVLINDNSQEIPAKLSWSGIEMTIETTAAEIKNTQKIVIRLIGVLELQIVPAASCLDVDTDEDIDAPYMPATLCITYLSDLFDKSTITSTFFSGLRKPLEIFVAKVEYIISNLKKNLAFSGPDPNKRKRSSSIPKKKVLKNIFSLTGTPKIINQPEIEAVRLFMPIRFRNMSWKLLYQTSVDGVSLKTIYKKCEKKAPLVLLIKTDKRVRMGAFLTEGLANKRSYYGTGEMFVFHFAPLFIGYKWSQKNKLFMASSLTDIAIGQSEGGGSAIYIGNHLEYGYSSACETFDSPPLAGLKQFHINEMELWHLSY